MVNWHYNYERLKNHLLVFKTNVSICLAQSIFLRRNIMFVLSGEAALIVSQSSVLGSDSPLSYKPSSGLLIILSFEQAEQEFKLMKRQDRSHRIYWFYVACLNRRKF